MLFLKHGGHILEQDDRKARELDRRREGITLAGRISRPLAKVLERDETTPFDYLFPDLADDPAATVAALKALGEAMVEQTPPPREENSTVPPVYTYWGQFVDHDLTANTDRDSTVSDITRDDLAPLAPADVTAKLRNLRRPTLDLDSLYGDGPSVWGNRSEDAGFYDGIRFRLGELAEAPGIPGVRIPPEGDGARDLPRIGTLIERGVIKESDFTPEEREQVNFRTRAFIGDTRNDENLIVGQLHLAFLRFHNRVVDRLERGGFGFGHGHGHRRQAQAFMHARRLTTWTYQWLCVHDWLRTLTFPGTVDKLLLGGPKHYAPRQGRLFMPLEFSVAAFRFGHSMVRGAYDHNRNFGLEANVAPVATFDDLFLFTGNGFLRQNGTVVPNPFRGLPTLPFNWPIEWDRFTDKGSALGFRFARKLDTRLAGPLLDLVNEGNREDDAAFRGLLKNLAQRNLLRGYLLAMPTGQAVAGAMGVSPLSEAELRQGNSDGVNAALEQGGFLQRTPLWYYVLKEAEVRANGNFLGELGSRIVCETVLGLLHHDRGSFLHARGWSPADGVRLDGGDPVVTIRDFFRFAGVGT